MQSPLLRVQTPMGKCSAERDSALQLLGEVCLQPRRSDDSAPSAPSAAHASAPEPGSRLAHEVWHTVPFLSGIAWKFQALQLYACCAPAVACSAWHVRMLPERLICASTGSAGCTQT